MPRGKSSDVKPKIIELDKNIGHKIVMSISGLFIDIYEPAHIVCQEISDMEGTGYTSAEGGDGMGQLFVADISVDGAAAL